MRLLGFDHRALQGSASSDHRWPRRHRRLGAKVGAKADALGWMSADGCGNSRGADPHGSTPADISGPTRSTYGSEGWGFESLRAHREARPLISGDAGRGPSSWGAR